MEHRKYVIKKGGGEGFSLFVNNENLANFETS